MRALHGALVVSGLAVVLTGCAAAPAAAPAVVVTPKSVSVTAEKGPDLPPCEYEDSDNCIWDAGSRGNGEGQSFIAWHGEVYYIELPEGVTAGDPFEELPEGPVSTFDPGVLVCGTDAGIAQDVDANGNNWAYCEPALAGE